MTGTRNIEVHHITRVEGHGNVVAHMENGTVKDVRFDIVEAPRFFEAILKGQPYGEVLHVAPRICGICSVAHKSAALKATEKAFGVKVGRQTEMLRRLAFHGEVIGSHILHVYFLAAPDFLGLNSVFPLAQSDPDTLKRAMALKRLGYDICAAVAGRHTHPVGMTAGGFSFVHSERELSAVRKRLADSMDDLRKSADLFAGFEIPEFERETEYVALTHPDMYAFYDGDPVSSLAGSISTDRYRETITEYIVPNSTAKHAKWEGPHYMVGALARFNTNYEQLNPMAKEIAEKLRLAAPCFNPFMNTLAQIVETVHCVEDSMDLIDELLGLGIRKDEEQATVVPQKGTGVGAVEAPRGTLFHEYHYDEHGVCTWANHVIPTAQNLANLEADMREMTPTLVDKDTDFIQKRLEMLVRAYDPCISCSTHVITPAVST